MRRSSTPRESLSKGLLPTTTQLRPRSSTSPRKFKKPLLSMNQSKGPGREFNICQSKLKSSTTPSEKNMLPAKEESSFKVLLLLPTTKELPSATDKEQPTPPRPPLCLQQPPPTQLVPSPPPTTFLDQVSTCRGWATLLESQSPTLASQAPSPIPLAEFQAAESADTPPAVIPLGATLPAATPREDTRQAATLLEDTPLEEPTQ